MASATPTPTDETKALEAAIADHRERRVKASTVTSPAPSLVGAMVSLRDADPDIGDEVVETREAYLAAVDAILAKIRDQTTWSAASAWHHVDDDGCGYAHLDVNVDVADVHVCRSFLWRRYGYAHGGSEDLLGRPLPAGRNYALHGWSEYDHDAESDGRTDLWSDVAAAYGAILADLVMTRCQGWAWRPSCHADHEALQVEVDELVRQAAVAEVASWDVPSVPNPSKATLWRALHDVPNGAGILRAGYAFDTCIVALRRVEDSSDDYATSVDLVSTHDMLDDDDEGGELFYLIGDFLHAVHGAALDELPRSKVREMRAEVEGWVRATIQKVRGSL
jgi:hypothetical protein